MTEKHAIFASSEFDDETIVKQLMSLDHQLLLKDHGPWLASLGPCTVTMASYLTKAKTKAEARNALNEYLKANNDLDKTVAGILANNSDSVLEGLKIVAESYLARSGRALPSWGDTSSSEAAQVPNVVLVGESGAKYAPNKLLAKGSAGLVYAGHIIGTDGKVALKRVYPTQAESALNEYKIAAKVRAAQGMSSYQDIIVTGEKEIWLVLPLIAKSDKYGVDLREYIVNGFFQEPGNDVHARSVVIQLLRGLQEASATGIIMRDVKPDNVLIKSTAGKYEAFWTDFGLAVDIGTELDGKGLRRVTEASSTPQKVQDDFVAWWYDVCKLVPRPKWQARRPPERGSLILSYVAAHIPLTPTCVQ